MCLGRGAVDFVREQDIGENRPGLEFELLLQGRIDGNAQHVRRQHVTGELDALEAAIQRIGERMGQRRLAHAGNAFYQQMSTGQDGHQRHADDLVIAANDSAQGLFKGNGLSGGGWLSGD